MTSFVFALDADATPLREAVVRACLEARFPLVRFEYGAMPFDGYENVISPISGYPHPTDPDAVIMRAPPADLVNQVREAFDDILLEAATMRVS